MSNPPPSAWVRRFVPLIRPRGRVLDLAAGSGRHAALLRESGHAVVAADRDTAALAVLFADDPGCAIRTLDLEDGAGWALGRGYDGIVIANSLHRPLFPALIAALAPGGILIYETFAAGNERFGRPSNPEFQLRPGVVDRPRPAVVQRIAAAQDGQPLPLPPGPAAS